MGMHGIPHIRWKKIIIYDLLAHIGVKGTEQWSLPKLSIIFHKNEAEATKEGVRASCGFL